MTAKKATGRKLAVNTTIDGETYPAGSVPPDDVAEKITNPKAWAVDEDVPAVEGSAE